MALTAKKIWTVADKLNKRAGVNTEAAAPAL